MTHGTFTDLAPLLPWPRAFTSVPGAEPERSRSTLARLANDVWATVRLLAASALDVPGFEAKLAIGEALHALTEVAASVEERTAELGRRTAPADRAPGTGTRSRLAAALSSPAGARLAAMPDDWLRPLLGTFGSAAFDPLLDGPSERVRRRALLDMGDAFTWFFEAEGRLAEAAGEAPPAPGASGSPASQASCSPAPRASGSLSRPTMGVRDARFRTFEHTRDYRKAADWRCSASEYEDDLIELLRVNRDEIDALETFALALFDLVEEAPLEALRHLARLAWDEARHAAIGHTLLAERGVDPYGYECSMIGIRVRGAMSGWDAWTQITLFGELGIIGPMRALVREAQKRGDDRVAAAFGFVCRDETMHLHDSRRLLAEHHPLGDLSAAGERARAHAGRTLQELGLFEAEQFEKLDGRQIFELLGE
ncbi:hypothetical protein [Nonomuraea lactucae]|uniref:hypothetical protein n=1 Tax=Nonomuraea lactucae TaxID=2249762 RepID=UPI000DE44DCF|nr:hypothetical protein [Nonomuraea lactucae]